MRKYERLVKTVINNIGGKKNIKNVTHCLTRLRFTLKDYDLVNEDNILNTEDVLTAQKSGAEYQVVVGMIVTDVFEEVSKQLGLENLIEEEEEAPQGNIFNRAIQVVTKSITPVLGVMSATGLMQGLIALLVAVGVLKTGTGEHTILLTLASTVLKFLPIFLGYSAAKTFKMKNPYIGMMMGAALVFPGLEDSLQAGGTALYTLFQGTMFATPVYSKFYGIPVMFPPGGYYSTVIPVLVIVFFTAKIEKFLNKHIPDIIGFAVVPALTVLISYPMSLLIIGPISNFAGLLLQNVVLSLYNMSSVLSSLFICLIYQPLVIFGLHWPLAPIQLTNYAAMGYDPVLVCIWVATFSQAGAAAAVWCRTKNKKTKAIAAPAFVSACCHIMEPAIYGITLPDKKRMLFAILGSTAGGVFLTISGAQNYTLSGTILGVVGFINPKTGSLYGLWMVLISILISAGIPFILCFLTYREEKVQKEINSISTITKMSINSPLKGTVTILEQAHDPSFATGKLGKGVAINPIDGNVYAPCDGTITIVFPTKHAIGITCDNGLELLIHIGIDTVKLDGKGFEMLKKQGDVVKQGELIMKFNLETIKKENYDLQSYVVITNADDYLDVLEPAIEGDEVIEKEDVLLQIIPFANRPDMESCESYAV
ncbi:MAG: beta-glucoside-specific PTS transporter subunit IIABC [Lachnospiraceae bacterium]|nr:beta-glucoside-specific PTS transporter subunit IIABC [Lachnospiraceae bacterium]